MTGTKGAGVLRCSGAGVLLVLVLGATATGQTATDVDRVTAGVRAAFKTALPFPETDDTGSVPANGSPDALWMVQRSQPGEPTIEITANPLNPINQARATRAMAQIGASIDAAQRRAELQYERALSEAKRTGRSQEVDGVTLSDEGVAGERIDAEGHVTIDVEFNQPVYSHVVVSGTEPAIEPSGARQLVIPGAVAVIAVPSNVYQMKVGDRTEDRFCQAETLVFFGAVSRPSVKGPSDTAFEIVADSPAGAGGPAIRSLVLRLRGNEVLMADLLRKADWPLLLELLK